MAKVSISFNEEEDVHMYAHFGDVGRVFVLLEQGLSVCNTFQKKIPTSES